MSDDTSTCAVCGQLIAFHRIIRWGGVAHTLSPDGQRWCSREEGERQQFVGEIDTLRAIIRSLRWRAGRLRTRNERWYEYDLVSYSDHWQKQLERYLQILEEYYPRGGR